MFWILELSFLALKLCLVTERMMLQIQQVVIGFLWSMAGLSLGDRVRSLAIWGALRVKLLLLHINLFISTSSDSGIWLGRLLEASYSKVFLSCPAGRRMGQMGGVFFLQTDQSLPAGLQKEGKNLFFLDLEDMSIVYLLHRKTRWTWLW